MARGPGRLSSLDLLPPEARDDVQWAQGEIIARNRTQADILFELNDRLCAKGLEEFTISKSAFSRWAINRWLAEQRNLETRIVLGAFNKNSTPAEVDETNVALAEFLKTLMAEVMSARAGEDFTAKEAMELSRGYLAVVQAQKISLERKRKAIEEFTQKAGEAVDAVARAKGLTQETADQLKAKILGIELKAP
jgi:hypothetical protein